MHVLILGYTYAGRGGVHVKSKYKTSKFKRIIRTITNKVQNERIARFLQVCMCMHSDMRMHVAMRMQVAMLMCACAHADVIGAASN